MRNHIAGFPPEYVSVKSYVSAVIAALMVEGLTVAEALVYGPSGVVLDQRVRDV